MPGEIQGRFVAVDLSTVPKDLCAAHLFGAVKGAYTGSDVVEVADQPFTPDSCKEQGFIDYSKQTRR